MRTVDDKTVAEIEALEKARFAHHTFVAISHGTIRKRCDKQNAHCTRGELTHMSKSFHPGDVVATTQGKGRVVYQRMAPPTYTDAEAVSVFLDSQADRLGYRGTMFSATSVTKLVEDTVAERARILRICRACLHSV
jgi:hypothetical protein